MDDGLKKTKNMKLFLCAFEQLSGLKINFHKNKLFFFGAAQDQADQYAYIFGFAKGELLMCYLGIPVHYRKLQNSY